MKRELCQKREEIRKRLLTNGYQPSDRQKIAIGLRLGTGCGKTHVLTEAPEWLNAHGVYVTYNMNQLLSVDGLMPDRAILLRLTLALHGCGSSQCAQFLASEESSSSRAAPLDSLRDLFLATAKSKAPGDIVIGVDELNDLGHRNAKIVVSELSYLAARFLKETENMCTVLVSSLASQTFETGSGRAVIDWVPNCPDIDALNYFARGVKVEKRDHAKALVNAVSGRHIRSIVLAFDLYMQDGTEPTVRGMYKLMKDRMGATFSPSSLLIKAKYVKDCISFDDPPICPPEIELMTDQISAIPPVILMMAFKCRDFDDAMHLENLLNAFALFDGGPGKQLENVAKHYDLLRASLGLPVVPGRVKVDTSTGDKSETWYKELKFHAEMVVSDLCLLTRKDNKVIASDVAPSFGCYYHPRKSNHPWVDRVFVAKHPDGDLCLVLAQDKVNADDFSGACAKLNEAAHTLTAASKHLRTVLLIVNVIGASEGTWTQSKLDWPNILIRGEKEVSRFYTVNFADMVWFSRERHLASL